MPSVCLKQCSYLCHSISLSLCVVSALPKVQTILPTVLAAPFVLFDL